MTQQILRKSGTFNEGSQDWNIFDDEDQGDNKICQVIFDAGNTRLFILDRILISLSLREVVIKIREQLITADNPRYEDSYSAVFEDNQITATDYNILLR